jgi:hypothetical protein
MGNGRSIEWNDGQRKDIKATSKGKVDTSDAISDGIKITRALFDSTHRPNTSKGAIPKMSSKDNKSNEVYGRPIQTRSITPKPGTVSRTTHMLSEKDNKGKTENAEGNDRNREERTDFLVRRYQKKHQLMLEGEVHILELKTMFCAVRIKLQQILILDGKMAKEKIEEQQIRKVESRQNQELYQKVFLGFPKKKMRTKLKMLKETMEIATLNKKLSTLQE